jgi:carboxypeptidase C (cathepsin A)
MKLTSGLVAAVLAVAPLAPITISAGQVPQPLIERAPSVATTTHSGIFGGQTVNYSAIVEEHILAGPDSVPNASLVTIAYVREGVADENRRPVMFVFNGGPGASSSPLHMNGLGPRRTSGATTIENPNSILDATDLVFIDPVGTGFSRPYTTDVGKQLYWSRTGDATSVKRVIDMWLAKHGRERSPRYIAGESYGTNRIGLIYKAHPDVKFDGILLVAVVGERENSGREMPYVTALPTMATSAWFWEKIDRKGRTVEQVYKEAVQFARTDYLSALVQGWSLPPAEKRRLAQKMSALVGLPAAFIEEKNLRLSQDDWMLNILKDRNQRTGMLDTRVTAARDTARTGGLNDPALGGGNMRIGTAMLAPAIVPGTVAPPPADANPPRGPSTLERYLKEDLQFHTLESYRSLNLDINGVWNHEDRGETNSFIAAAMRRDLNVRLFWTAGYYDLTTPAYGTQYSFDQVGLATDRTTGVILPGPHGVFADDANRELLASRLRKWIH